MKLTSMTLTIGTTTYTYPVSGVYLTRTQPCKHRWRPTRTAFRKCYRCGFARRTESSEVDCRDWVRELVAINRPRQLFAISECGMVYPIKEGA